MTIVELVEDDEPFEIVVNSSPRARARCMLLCCLVFNGLVTICLTVLCSFAFASLTSVEGVTGSYYAPPRTPSPPFATPPPMSPPPPPCVPSADGLFLEPPHVCRGHYIGATCEGGRACSRPPIDLWRLKAWFEAFGRYQIAHAARKVEVCTPSL